MEDYQKTTNNDKMDICTNPVLKIWGIKSSCLEVLKEGNK